MRPHQGRSGWTWYTGSAAWTWRFALEGILGLNLTDGRLRIGPCLPPEWNGYEAKVRRDGGVLNIRVENPNSIVGGKLELTVDSEVHPESEIEFPESGAERNVIIQIVE